MLAAECACVGASAPHARMLRHGSDNIASKFQRRTRAFTKEQSITMRRARGPSPASSRFPGLERAQIDRQVHQSITAAHFDTSAIELATVMRNSLPCQAAACARNSNGRETVWIAPWTLEVTRLRMFQLDARTLHFDDGQGGWKDQLRMPRATPCITSNT